MKKNDKKILARNIRLFMAYKRWTQADLARKADIKPQQLNRCMTQKNYPNTKNLAKIADSLEVSIDQLTTDSSETTASSPLHDVHIRKVVSEVLSEDLRLKLIEQYLEKVIRILDQEEKEKLINGGQLTPSPKRKMDQE